jgi:phosphoenolpyruvate carboxylase
VSLDWAQDFLRREAARIDADPLTNSVFSRAQTLFRKRESGEAEPGQLPALAEKVHLTLLDERADQFRRQHSGADAALPPTSRLSLTLTFA